MAVFVLIFSYFLLYKIIYRLGLCWRQSAITAVVVWGCIIVATTETLSLLSLISYTWVVILWIGINIGLLLIHQSLDREKMIKSNLTIKAPNIFILITIGIIILITGVTALAYPPNTGDSLSYHMGRVVHWVQNQNIEPYPTSIFRQIHQPPLAEFIIMHFQILSKSDYFANIPQWLGMIGSIIGVSLIAKKLKANVNGQIISALICATIPMGILQSSTAKNDYISALWIVCFVYFMLCFLKEKKIYQLVLVGASMSLAFLTKSTAYLFALPFFIWFLMMGISKWKTKFLKYIVIIFLIIIIINIGYYIRNTALVGNPLGPGREDIAYDINLKYVNDSFTIPLLISNLTRNIALQIGTLDSKVNALTYSLIVALHSYLGIDTADKRITWDHIKFTPSVLFLSRSDGNAGNPFHFLLILISFFYLIFILPQKKKSMKQLSNTYTICVLFGFILFSFLIKWQPWHSRLHLPFFVLASVSIGLFLQNMNAKIARFTLLILLLFSIPYLFLNPDRPLFDRQVIDDSRLEKYFYQISNLEFSYNEVAKIIHNTSCEKIGLDFGRDDPEYALWVALQKDKKSSYQIEHIQLAYYKGHIDMTNHTSKLILRKPYKTFNPCIVVSSQILRDDVKMKGNTYKLVWRPENWMIDYPVVYLKK